MLIGLLMAASWLGPQAGPADARDRDLLRLPPQLSDTRARGITPAEAARIAQQQNGGGRVLAVEPEAGGYRVKLLKNGDVRILYVPAA